MPVPLPETAIDELATPVLWLDADGVIADANAAAANWLGAGRRRLIGVPAAALEPDGDRLALSLAAGRDTPLRVRRVAMAFPGAVPWRFADLWLAPRADGHWLEAHPVDEFPGQDPAHLLPAALSASLKTGCCRRHHRARSNRSTSTPCWSACCALLTPTRAGWCACSATTILRCRNWRAMQTA